MKEIIKFEGNLFQVLHRQKNSTVNIDGKLVSNILNYELVRRPPGVRAIITDNEKILLNYEYRYELNAWDYRLPGGKVYDTNKEYCDAQKNGQILVDVVEKLKQEVKEEADIEVLQYKLLNISHTGLTIEWDLYYYLIDKFVAYENSIIQKTEYEFIKHEWVDFETALKLCYCGKVSEARSAFEIVRLILTR